MAKSRGLGKSVFDIFDDNVIETKKGAGEISRERRLIANRLNSWQNLSKNTAFCSQL